MFAYSASFTGLSEYELHIAYETDIFLAFRVIMKGQKVMHEGLTLGRFKLASTNMHFCRLYFYKINIINNYLKPLYIYRPNYAQCLINSSVLLG